VKTCEKCKDTKPVDDFAPNRNRKDGRHNWCRECSRAYRREYEKTHPRTYEQRKKEYYEGDWDHLRARRRVNHAVEKGALPRVSTQACLDCGAQAYAYDHYKGYAEENWLTVQPVCRKCSDARDIKRGNKRRYAAV
jgi:hypothetical protein